MAIISGSLQNWATITAATFVVYNVGLVIYRLFFHPLAKFPGPRISAATALYENWWDMMRPGMFLWEIDRMHKEYGPIVRINPDELHIRDSDFYDQIYTNGPGKRDRYARWQNIAGAPHSTFNTTNHDHHRFRRAALNPYFSKRRVTELEPMVVSKINKLSKRFEECSTTSQVIKLDVALTAFTLDIISEYAFGHSYNYIDEPDFKEAWRDVMTALFENAALRRTLPGLVEFMEKLPDKYLLKIMPNLGIFMNWRADLHAQVMDVMKNPSNRDDTVFHTLLGSDLPPHEKTLQRLVDEGEIIVGAGTETTARTISHLIFHIYTNPEILQRLRIELDGVMPQRNSIPTWTELERLPYMSAVIQEGLRVTWGITTRSPRLPDTELQYKDWVIPARTIISSTVYWVLADAEIFPDPKRFDPERWMQSKRLDKYMASFSKGSRSCLGINLAYAELFLSIAIICKRFDFEMYDTTILDVSCVRDGFVPGRPKHSEGVKVLVHPRAR